MGKRIALHITRDAERQIRGGHPWLHANSITKQSHEGKTGDLAVVFDQKRKFLAIGLYDPDSEIRCRVLQHHTPATINGEFFEAQFANAVQKRAELPPNTTGYRLLNGENDGFPGLILDRYADVLVVKLYTAAWVPFLPTLTAVFRGQFPDASILLQTSRNMEASVSSEWLAGEPVAFPITFIENGFTFEADPLEGQKTGFFLDQRENRARVETFSAGKRVLNVFAYTGGFSLYAARGGATHVTSLDISQPALDAAERNFLLNQDAPNVAACNHTIVRGDAFDELARLANHKQTFDVVIIDPPSFANKAAHVNNALGAYQKLATRGLRVLAPEGILVMASCSSRVSSEAFFNAIHEAANQMGYSLTEIERTGHALDHPITFREGAYLKCLFTKAIVKK